MSSTQLGGLRLSSCQNFLFRVQSKIHDSNSAVLPGTLLLVASGLVFYRHVTAAEEASDSLKTFLALIVVQMLPLVFLEMKILSCNNPVDLLCKFGGKVLLMHASFLTVRISCCPFVDLWWPAHIDFAGLAFTCAALRMGFKMRFSIATIWEHRDVWFLTLLACAAALLTEFSAFVWQDAAAVQNVANMISSYIELLAFLPAVWMVHRSNKSVGNDAANMEVGSDPRDRALWFFAFMVSFYFMEDIIVAMELVSYFPLAAMGHLAHFLLLLDFGGFLLAHLYNPEKLKGELLRWLPDDRSVWI